MEGVIGVQGGQLVYDDIKTLSKLVRGHELITCYWDATRIMRSLMQEIYDAVCTDELGASRGVRPFDTVWAAYLREIDYEMGRLHQWYLWQSNGAKANG
jgi:hypothetical protein